MGSMLRKLALFGGAAAVAGLIVAERKRPLRERTFAIAPRTISNLALGAGCAVVIAALEEPLCRKIADQNAAEGRGFAHKLPRPLRLVGGLLAMDYGFYLWHVLTHKVPFLWRFHRVHHLDPDMDASTAIRFHPVDMLVSLPFRLLQVRLSGVDRRGLTFWRNLFNAHVLFHHSNLQLPAGWDSKLSAIFTTPEMHGIHHSRIRAESDSNWTSGFSFWDRLHGTFRTRANPRAIDIGVADAQALADIPIIPALQAPFRPQPANNQTSESLPK